MSRRRRPLSKEEHEKIAEDLLKVLKLLDPIMDRLYEAYPIRDKRCLILRNSLTSLSSKLCCLLDADWFNLPDKERGESRSPYYGDDKVGWM